MLRSFVIHDEALRGAAVGTLWYDEDSRRFGMTVDKNIEPEKLPLSLEIFAANGKYTLSDEDTLRWIRGRICPPSRHNIGEILRSLNLAAYSEFGIIAHTMAKCDKDGLYLTEFEVAEVEVTE